MIFAVTVFTSAFLLFQVQPIIARHILPWYGGSPAVWTTCLLFFQLGLLVGYGYAHALVRFLSTKQQVMVHVGLLIVSLALLPIAPALALKPAGTGSPLLGIILLLGSSVGLPFVLISGTAPLLQHWYASRFTESSPYRLYALSNLAALLALLSYPFLFERVFDLSDQTRLWSVGYALFIVACAASAVSLLRFLQTKKKRGEFLRAGSTQGGVALPDIEKGHVFLWLGLSATGSILLLAISNTLTQDVPVIAFLWVVPLSLYLVSFIIAFDHPRWYRRGLWVTALLLVVAAVAYLVAGRVHVSSGQLLPVMGIYLALMFVGCTVCHGEMVRLKPEPEQLTLYYLVIALGGSLGGVFVAVVCPLIFSGYWELHIGVIMALVFPGVAIGMSVDWSSRRGLKRALGVLFLLGATAAAALFANDIAKRQQDVVFQARSFYGIARVTEEDKGDDLYRYEFYQGNMQQGQQFRSKALRDYPSSYYGRHSGVAIAIRKHPKREARNAEPNTNAPGLHVGVIGMGAGTLAGYARRRDHFRFYEINPEVVAIANKYFSYVKRSNGVISTVVGDGRVSLEQELKILGPQEFDVLAIDAFSSDAIPVHLLTLEAGKLYLSHLAEGGILAFHITNRYLDLKPVVLALAWKLGLKVIRITEEEDASIGVMNSEWLLMTTSEEFIANNYVVSYTQSWPAEDDKAILWTDQFSTIAPLLK